MIFVNTLGALLAIFATVIVKVDSTFLSAQACEGNTLNIRCEKGLINVIKANYGRLSRSECNADCNTPILTVDCKSSNSLDIVKAQCSNEQSCSVQASNGVFGDPCYGTYKYLQVEYQCIKNVNPWKTVIACEHSQLNLACGAGEVIKISSANYGRTSRNLCNDNGNAPILTTQCKSWNSIAIVEKECSGKQKCIASNDVFGDPCFGTFKYLEVGYVCEKPKPCNG